MRPPERSRRIAVCGVEQRKLQVDVHAVRTEQLLLDVDESVLLGRLIRLAGRRVEVSQGDHVFG